MAPDHAGRRDPKKEVVEKWMREHRGRMLAVAKRYAGTVVGAQDIVQKASAVAYEKREQRPPPERLGAWLCEIVKRVGMNEARKRKRREELRREMLEGTDGAVSGRREREGPEDDWRRERVVEALPQLPPRLREVAVLVLFEQLPTAEVAKRLGVSEAVARVYRGRAVSKLRELCKPGGGGLTDTG